MANKTSQHILGTAANLLGFLLVVISSVHLSNKTNNTLFDELTLVTAMLLVVSCIFSFLSIRTDNYTHEQRLEQWANILFCAALFTILFIVIIICFNIYR